MNDIRDCYITFGLEPNASPSELKQAYKDMACVWHPDRFTHNPRLQAKAEDQLKKINECYEILKSHDSQRQSSQSPPQDSRKTNIREPSKSRKREQPQKKPTNLCELRDQLILGNWYQADVETQKVLLESTQRNANGWMGADDVDGLLYEDLQAIDRLWLEFSHQRFGFSVQKERWHNLNCQSAFWTPVYEQKFGDALGWRNNGFWIRPEQKIDYSLMAPEGCFPRLYIFALWGWWSYTHGKIGKLRFQFDRIFLRL